MNRKSFTLLELVIVLALLAIITSVAVARFVDLSDRSFGIAEQATMDAFRAAVLLYKAKYDVWPDWQPTSEFVSPTPFDLLDNPPPNKPWPWGGGFGNGRYWNWDRTEDVMGIKIGLYCPHYNPAAPTRGIKWYYFVISGQFGGCAYPGPSKTYSAGSVIRCFYTALTHKDW